VAVFAGVGDGPAVAVLVGANLDNDGASAAGSAYAFRWAAAQVYVSLVLK
jgi:hypothetical protein